MYYISYIFALQNTLWVFTGVVLKSTHNVCSEFYKLVKYHNFSSVNCHFYSNKNWGILHWQVS